MKFTNVICLKNTRYKNTNYIKGDIIKMSTLDIKVYIECGIVKICHVPETQKKIDYTKLSYNQLRKACKNKNIPAIGTKETMITNLSKTG